MFPHIAIGVKTQADVDWGWKESGLPFYDIMLLENLPKVFHIKYNIFSLRNFVFYL